MGGRGIEEQVEAEIPVEQMKRYISYCRRYVLQFPTFVFNIPY
jgi:hypothetical protein